MTTKISVRRVKYPLVFMLAVYSSQMLAGSTLYKTPDVDHMSLVNNNQPKPVLEVRAKLYLLPHLIIQEDLGAHVYKLIDPFRNILRGLFVEGEFVQVDRGKSSLLFLVDLVVAQRI